MKRILYFTAILLMLLPVLSEESVVFGQNMATEYYDLNYLWHQADKTKYFIIERCKKCGQFVASDDPDDREENMEKHRKRKHPFNDDCNDGNAGNDSDDDYNYGNTEERTDCGSFYSNGSSDRSNNIYVVNLHSVALAMDILGVCDAKMFMDDYDSYYGMYVTKDAVLAANVDTYLRKHYQPKSKVTITAAINNNYPFILLSNPLQSGTRINGKEIYYYDVIYNYNLNEHSNQYHYLYVFDKMYYVANSKDDF
jgi:hypothetical protein